MHYPNYVHKNNKDMRIHVKNNDEMLLWKLQIPHIIFLLFGQITGQSLSSFILMAFPTIPQYNIHKKYI